MGFTNVAWESRSTEQLARDLTDGPGPKSVGEAGAAWVRVANEFASISEEYGKVVEKIKASFASDTADAMVGKLEEFGGWIQALTVGVPGWDPTWMFYRNTLVSDLIFTALFYICHTVTMRGTPGATSAEQVRLAPVSAR